MVWDCGQLLGESWVHHTLEATSIDMDCALLWLVAQVCNMRNEHWVFCLSLVSPTCTFLCLMFDFLSNRLYLVGANTKELAIADLVAEQEGIEPRPQKKSDRFLGEFGIVAFAIAPLYSTFLRQKDGVRCHHPCLLMLHCLLCWCVLNGTMQLPEDSLWLLCEVAQATLYYRNSAHTSPMQTTPNWALAWIYAAP